MIKISHLAIDSTEST